MTQRPTDDEITAMRQFKQQIKDWLTQNNFTQKELSLKLGVTYGAVRNWLSSDYAISGAYMKRIRELMANPAAMKHPEEDDVYLTQIIIQPFTANMSMWRSSAQVKNVSFAEHDVMGTDAVQFARWSTAIINDAIRAELRKHEPEEIKQKAREIQLSNDPISYFDSENAYYEEMAEPEVAQARSQQGVRLRLPILANRINDLYLSIAAKCADKAQDDFIADALNEAADAEFDEALNAFLSTEESVLGEVKVKKKYGYDQDIPF